MKYDRAWAEAQFSRKAKLKFLFFWGHQASRDGTLSPACFSQWWPASFTIEGKRYATAEHWMMAGKAKLFGDEDAASRICAAGSPKQAKELGRQVKGFDGAAWDAEKYAVVLAGSMAKFGQNAALGKFLLETGDKIIVEASPVDRIWGIGLSADDKAATNPLRWRGQNLLGFALMETRDRLGKRAG